MSPASPRRAALYVRVSTKRQAETGMSIGDQVSRLSAHCRERGWQIGEIYQDSGYTAKTLKRPALDRLLADAVRKPRAFDLVLAIDNSRLARVTADFLVIQALLTKNSIGLVCLNLPEGESPEAKLVAGIVASVSQFENAQRARRVQQCMQTNAENGYWNGGLPPFGYRTVEAIVAGTSTVRMQLEIDPSEADIVRRIYRLRLDGVDSRGPLGIQRIAQELSASKIPNRSGKAWSVQAVHGILRDTTYVGRHPYHLHHLDAEAAKNTRLRDVTFMPCAAIVDQDAFENVQKLLDDANARVTPGRLTNGSLMLTGLLYCANCGAMMHIATGKGGRYRYYVCGERHRTGSSGCSTPRLPLGKVEEAVAEVILPFVLRSDRIPALAAAIERELEDSKAPSEAELRSKQAALNESNRRLEKILDRIIEAKGATLKHLERRLKEEQSTHDRLQEEAAVLRGRVRERIPSFDPAHYCDLAELVTRALKSGPLPLRQGIARRLIQRVDFDGSALRLVPKSLDIAANALPSAA